jgi:hypothetical protein
MGALTAATIARHEEELALLARRDLDDAVAALGDSSRPRR